MKKTLKCLLPMLLAAVFLFSAAAYADGPYTHGYFKYLREDGGVTITLYFGNEETVEIPSQINGSPVSKIAAGAFAECTDVKTVILPDTIMEIEPGAFGSWITVDDSRTLWAKEAQEEQQETGDPQAETTQPASQGEQTQPSSQAEQTQSDGSTEQESAAIIEQVTQDVEAGLSNMGVDFDDDESAQTEPEEKTDTSSAAQDPAATPVEPTPGAETPAQTGAPASTEPEASAPADSAIKQSVSGAVIAVIAVLAVCGGGGYAYYNKKKKGDKA